MADLTNSADLPTPAVTVASVAPVEQDPTALLDIRHLSVSFARPGGERLRAVVDLSLTVQRGQTVAIVGESGSGKSVTALAVMGLVAVPPGEIEAGEIWFADPAGSGQAVNLLALAPEALRQVRGGRVAMIFQEPMSALNPVYTCGFQLIEAIRLHSRLSGQAARERAIALLEEVKLLPSADRLAEEAQAAGQREVSRWVAQQQQAWLDRYPHQLSGGQIQRVTIAMALAGDPVLLIADEPTTALDVTVQARILDLLKELRDRRGMAVLFVTHDLGIVAQIADQVAVMYQGKIVEAGPAQEIFHHATHPYTRGLLACRPQSDRRLRLLPTVGDFLAAAARADAVAAGAISERSPAELSLAIEDIPADETRERLEHLQAQPPLLTVRDLRVGYPLRGVLGLTRRYFLAVNGVSFAVYPGETLGLVGESGCGKSTLARAIVQLVRPLAGEIAFEEQNLLQLRGRALRQLRQEVQIIFQDPFSSLDPRLTVGAAIAEPLVLHSQRGRAGQTRDRVAELLDRVGLETAAASKYPHEFSGGQRQRICIARALALNPKFLICDESVSALDVSVQAQILNLLKELQASLGLTYIFISHDLGVVKFMSDRIAVMNQGKIEELGPADRVYNQPESEYTRQLIAAIPA